MYKGYLHLTSKFGWTTLNMLDSKNFSSSFFLSDKILVVQPNFVQNSCSLFDVSIYDQGPMLWFLKYFCRKFLQKIGVFGSKQS
jgi:hypothetical protein